jgi:hypothetical protein
MDVTYFAYGSNLCLPRLANRVAGVRALGPASLPGYELRWHKRSVDRSGKCSIVPSASAAAVVQHGYAELTVYVQSSQGVVSAQTYVAEPTCVDNSLRPYAWYRDLVVSGAESHNLPAEYVESLRLVVVWQDQDAERASRNWVSLPCDGSK